MKLLTEQQRCAYLNSPVCPICRSDNIKHDKLKLVDKRLVCEVICLDCEGQWHEVYQLVALSLTNYLRIYKEDLDESA